MFGLDFGATIFGSLFDIIGTKNTLVIFGGITGIMFIIFLLYIKFSKKVDIYEKIPEETVEYNNTDCEEAGIEYNSKDPSDNTPVKNSHTDCEETGIDCSIKRLSDDKQVENNHIDCEETGIDNNTELSRDDDQVRNIDKD